MEKLTLLEKEIIQPMLQLLPEKLWVYYFPVLLSNNSVYIDRIDGATVLLIKENDTWDLLIPPLGNCSNGTFENIFNYLKELNRNCKGAILNCTSSFIEKLDPEQYTVKLDCWDYIYDKKEQLSLGGKKFSEIRNHINYFQKHNNYTVSPYSPEDYDECDHLFNGWRDKKQSNGTVIDEHIAQMFQNLCLFHDMFGIVVRVDGKLVGFSIGGLLQPNEAICIIRKTNFSYRGLSEFIDHCFYRHIPESVNLVNDGDDLNSESLRLYKMKWKPVGFRNYYTVQQSNANT
ncbi:MAG: DUF2156 domain-containing protein [Methanosarcinaceae archaeon]|nr:DUF2156 domain-containing protein [Methanosarcinaceae archaeon]